MSEHDSSLASYPSNSNIHAKIQQNLLLTGVVVIVPIDVSSALVVTDVIESSKAGARNSFDKMIGNQKVFLPSHEHHITISKILLACLHVVQAALELLEQGLEVTIKKADGEASRGVKEEINKM